MGRITRKPKTTAEILPGGVIKYKDPDVYFVERSSKHILGKPPKYSPEGMLKEFQEYLQWCKENPLVEEKAFSTGTVDMNKIRMATVQGFYLWAGISKDNFYRYRSGEHGLGEFVNVCNYIVETIDAKRGNEAAADLLNAGFVAKLMGLSEKIEQVNYNSVQMTPEQIKAISKQLEDEV